MKNHATRFNIYSFLIVLVVIFIKINAYQFGDLDMIQINWGWNFKMIIPFACCLLLVVYDYLSIADFYGNLQNAWITIKIRRPKFIALLKFILPKGLKYLVLWLLVHAVLLTTVTNWWQLVIAMVSWISCVLLAWQTSTKLAYLLIISYWLSLRAIICLLLW